MGFLTLGGRERAGKGREIGGKNNQLGSITSTVGYYYSNQCSSCVAGVPECKVYRERSLHLFDCERDGSSCFQSFPEQETVTSCTVVPAEDDALLVAIHDHRYDRYLPAGVLLAVLLFAQFYFTYIV